MFVAASVACSMHGPRAVRALQSFAAQPRHGDRACCTSESHCMNVAFSCPNCGNTSRAELPSGESESSHPSDFACSGCGETFRVPAGALDGEQLNRCLICPSTDLYLRKDFPQRLGVGIVTVGILASCIAWGFYHMYLTFAILFATALVDVVLYLVVPDALMCYRCGAQYRRAPGLDSHAPFSLETHERHRQQKARLAEHKAAK